MWSGYGYNNDFGNGAKNKRMNEPDQDIQDGDGVQAPSKSQRKRDMEALQKLGEALLPLADAELAKLPLTDELRSAVQQAKAIKAHGGRKRQLQYIGKLMRAIDAEPIRAALEQRQLRARAQTQRFHQWEELRDRLLRDGEPVIEEICQRYPQAERQRLRQLHRQAVKEREREQAPKAARNLFRYLRELGDEA